VATHLCLPWPLGPAMDLGEYQVFVEWEAASIWSSFPRRSGELSTTDTPPFHSMGIIMRLAFLVRVLSSYFPSDYTQDCFSD